MGTGSLPGVKAPELGFDHPFLSRAEVQERQSYTSTPPRAFVACYRVKFSCNCYYLFVSKFFRCHTTVYMHKVGDQLRPSRSPLLDKVI